MTSSGWEDVTILQNLDPHLTVTAVKLAMSANLTFMTPMTMLPTLAPTMAVAMWWRWRWR